jgi:hypothetical protein
VDRSASAAKARAGHSQRDKVSSAAAAAGPSLRVRATKTGVCN